MHFKQIQLIFIIDFKILKNKTLKDQTCVKVLKKKF